jgi:HEAT repeat protein
MRRVESCGSRGVGSDKHSDGHDKIGGTRGDTMQKADKLQIIRRLSEKELTTRLLIPLYESSGMGCRSVRYVHKRLEFGKDVIYCREDEYGNRVYTGIQVKKTPITSRNIDTVFRQTNEAFGEAFTDLADGKQKSLDRFVVLTPNEFLEDAKESLYASLRGARLDKVVTCVDGSRLVDLLDKHLPSAFWDEYDCFKRYFEAMSRDFATVKDISAIGQKEGVRLRTIYVPMRLSEVTPESISTERLGEQSLGTEAAQTERQMFLTRKERAKVVDGGCAVREHKRLVIVGDPGSGKTMLLRHLCLQMCNENLERQERTCIPIPVTLRELSESGLKLRRYVEKVFEKYEFPNVRRSIEADLKSGRCRLFLDGFDELATKEARSRIARDITAFAKRYSQAPIVATSRRAGYHGELKGFTQLAILEFNDAQMRQFVANWFEDDVQPAQRMCAGIMAHPPIKMLAKNPLMIAIIALIYEEGRELPQRRADLYRRCVDVLLSRWDIQKSLKNKYRCEKKEFVLRKLAFHAHTCNKRVLSAEETHTEILRHFPTLGLSEGDVSYLLDEIWQRSYLLRQVSPDTYDFLHLSFQEYFAALELREKTDGLDILVKHVCESWWQEPTLLYAGIANDATTLIRRIQSEIPEDIFHSNLMLCGRCIADAEHTEVAIRDAIVNELWSLYRGSDFELLRATALDSLAPLRPAAIVSLLTSELESAKRSSVREDAAHALGRLRTERAIGPLIGAILNEVDEHVRWAAGKALIDIGSEQAVDPMMKAMGEGEISVRSAAVDVLGGLRAERAVKPLVSILADDSDRFMRRIATMALGRLPKEEVLGPLLEALVEDKDDGVRVNAAFALAEIGDDRALAPLLRAVEEDRDYHATWAVAAALGTFRSEKAVPLLIRLLEQHKHRVVRGGAAEALGCIGSEQAVKPLMQAVQTDSDGFVRGDAAVALGRIANEQVCELLLSMVANECDAHARVGAARALGNIGNEIAVPALIRVLAEDKDSDVRGSAANALGRIGSKVAVQALMDAMNDCGACYSESRTTVKDAAFGGLAKICRTQGIRILART